MSMAGILTTLASTALTSLASGLATSQRATVHRHEITRETIKEIDRLIEKERQMQGDSYAETASQGHVTVAVADAPAQTQIEGAESNEPENTTEHPGTALKVEQEAPVELASDRELQEISVGCVSCGRSHLIGTWAFLDEAVRFSMQPEGIDHPEAQRRILAAQRELVALERLDWAPEAVAKAPPDHRAVIKQYQPRVRRLRQELVNRCRTPEDLKKLAAEASELTAEFQRASRHLSFIGVEADELAQESGEA